jgi:NADPH2:quinone reductase
MTAIAIATPGGPEGLRPVTQSVPFPREDEVLIRVAAAGVNAPDLAQRRGLYDPPPDASPLPGLEVSGTIAAIGSGVEKFTVGDRVMALTNGGGYAEYVAVPAGQVLPVPEGWSMAAAAALPETWFTVTQTLVMRAGVTQGMWVLVHGGAGGIGGAAITIAKILGAKAIAIVSSEEKAAYAKKLGATETIDRTKDDILARVMAITGKRGVDRIVDLVGGEMAALNVKASARDGHIVQVSTLGGGEANVPLRLMMAKALTLSGSTLRPQSSATKAAIATRIRTDLFAALESGDMVKPKIRRFPLAEAAAAHVAMEDPDHLGKIVLVTAWGESA